MKDELVDLQDKLGGVYDLTNTVDCQSVIRMLLTDLKREKVKTEQTQKRLRALADRVLLSDACNTDKELRQVAYDMGNSKG